MRPRESTAAEVGYTYSTCFSGNLAVACPWLPNEELTLPLGWNRTTLYAFEWRGPATSIRSLGSTVRAVRKEMPRCLRFTLPRLPKERSKWPLGVNRASEVVCPQKAPITMRPRESSAIGLSCARTERHFPLGPTDATSLPPLPNDESSRPWRSRRASARLQSCRYPDGQMSPVTRSFPPRAIAIDGEKDSPPGNSTLAVPSCPNEWSTSPSRFKWLTAKPQRRSSAVQVSPATKTPPSRPTATEE